MNRNRRAAIWAVLATTAVLIFGPKALDVVRGLQGIVDPSTITVISE